MFKLRSERVTISVDAVFSPPVFHLSEIPTRFFDLVYSFLPPEFTVDPQDLQVLGGNTLGDVVVKYKIFGGNSTISMSADKLSAKFPMVLPEDYQIIEKLLHRIGIGFQEKFSECGIVQVNESSYEHASVVSGGTSNEYLARFEIPTVNYLFRELGELYIPGARFMVFGHKTNWQASCSIEKSQYQADGLFLNFDVIMKDIGSDETLDMQIKRAKTIMEKCKSALELSFES